MKNWRVEYRKEGQTLVEMKIRKGVFQGDSLSSLLFIIEMIPPNHLLRKCTVWELQIFKITEKD